MIIAIPAVTKYINDSRQNAYVDIAKNIVNGATVFIPYNISNLGIRPVITIKTIDIEQK